jgi:hypothetical protein
VGIGGLAVLAQQSDQRVGLFVRDARILLAL